MHEAGEESVSDAEDVLEDYHLHFDVEESGGVFGFVHKKARGIEIASAIEEVRDKIRDIKIPKIKSEDSNNLNIRDSNQTFILGGMRFYDLVGIDLTRRELVQMLCAKEESLLTVSMVGMGGLGKTTLTKEVYKQAKRGGLNPSLQFETFAWIPVSQAYKATYPLGRMIAQLDKAKRDMDLVVEMT